MRAPAHEGQVVALQFSAAHQAAQTAVGLFGAGHGEQAGGVAIEPVDDPGSLSRASGHAVEEAVDERPFGAPRPGVHHQTGRLVDD